MFLNLALFLLLAAIVIAVAKPTSKLQVWLFSIFAPMVFALVFALCVAIFSNSRLSMGYVMGGSVGGNVPSILITIITLFFCLKKKMECKEGYKYPKGIFAVIIVCAIIGCIQLYLSYQSRKTIEQYVEMKSNENQQIVKQENPIIEADKDNPVTKKVREDMIDAAQSYNKDLPEEIGNGLTMVKCELESYSMVYTIQWKGLSPSDFTDNDVSELRESTIEGLKEENSALMKAMLNNMKDYGYDFIYRYVNEKGEELCSINISPYDL